MMMIIYKLNQFKSNLFQLVPYVIASYVFYFIVSSDGILGEEIDG